MTANVNRPPTTGQLTCCVPHTSTGSRRSGALKTLHGRCAAAGSPPRQGRPLSSTEVEALVTGDSVKPREQVLWRMLYETGAAATEVLALNIEDLDLTSRCAKVRRKGGMVRVIEWKAGTAALLPEFTKERQSGPLLLADYCGTASTTPSGRRRLSYRRAAELFAAATTGEYGQHATFRQLRQAPPAQPAQPAGG